MKLDAKPRFHSERASEVWDKLVAPRNPDPVLYCHFKLWCELFARIEASTTRPSMNLIDHYRWLSNDLNLTPRLRENMQWTKS